MPLASGDAEETWEAAAESLGDLLPSADAGPEAQVMRAALLEEIEAALAELPEEQRAVFVAQELEGVTFRELAARSGVSINTLIARKRYALLQTPEFVEEFILGQTLDPAIAEFGLKDVCLIDPTCGSGHFLLGAFRRLLGRWQKEALTENIADLAGLAIAYDAWKTSLGGKEAPVENGLTGDQQFFLAFAQEWQMKQRDEALRQRLSTDGHAPAHWRVLTVRNIDAWYGAFEVAPTDGLFVAPNARVRVW